MGLKAQKIKFKLSNKIKDSKEFSKFFRVLGTMTEIITKKIVNCSKKNSRTFSGQKSENGKFQDKFQDKKNSNTFPGFPGFPGRVETLEEIHKIEYLENKNSVLDEIKSIFHSF